MAGAVVERVAVTVTPSTLKLAPGAKGTFTVSFTRATAAYNEYAFGSLTWTGGGYTVRSPIAVRPVPVAAPASVSGTGASGSTTWKITPGYSGTLATRVDGLVGSAGETKSYADGNAGDFDTTNPESNLADPAVQATDVTVGLGTSYARWSTFADASSAATDDIDLYVYRYGTPGDPATLTLVGQSATGSSDETVSSAAPAAGSYRVYVHNWDSDSASNDIALFTWLLDGAPKGNADVTAPASVTVGAPVDVKLDWTGLAAGQRYLGRVVYGDGTADRGSTVVSIRP